MFGLGLPEMALLLFLAVMLFGPKWFVKMGRTAGESARGFADALKESKDAYQKASIDPGTRPALKAAPEEPQP